MSQRSLTFVFRIHQNLRLAVYCGAIAAGGAAEWDFAWSQLQGATVANEASILMSALACTVHTPLLQRCVFLHVSHGHTCLHPSHHLRALASSAGTSPTR